MTGPTVAVVFAPDPDLGPDPDDRTARTPRRIGEVIPPGTDMLLIWREWGDDFDGGSRTHVIGSGSWENVTHDQIEAALTTLGGVV